MKSLLLKKLLLLSVREKAAQIVEFDSKTTVVLGENDTGKSCLIKSVYAAFGADPAKVNPKWLDAKAIMSCDGSTPSTEPRGTRSAIAAEIFPSPQPTSRIFASAKALSFG